MCLKKFHALFLATILLGFPQWLSAQSPPKEKTEKTVFQTASPWQPKLDIRSDTVLVYGMNDSFLQRMHSWQERGYGIHFMTGVAWGDYQEYINGAFDGQKHLHEGQVQRDGEMIMHHPGVPYMVPTASYIAYLKSLIKQAIDAGVRAIHLEEPEFWNRAGYSEGFKHEWREFYNEPWQPQHQSPEATYRSAKLKYRLYYNALAELFSFVSEYSQSIGERVRCYVPTHTLINYSAWGIVSPESRLAHLPGMDGYIGQVWTGTARTPTLYQGEEKERTFENAYLEYASMAAMTQPTNKRVYFLTDPIEDNPNYTWQNYKLNYEATFTAQLLHPGVAHYEVMPWPNRIFNGKYKVAGSEQRQPIPKDYATEILTLINTLNDMPAGSKPVQGTQGVGVMISDSMMFQRFPTHEGYDDPRLSNFYGMALPLLKRGIPLQLVQMENLSSPKIVDGFKVLVMSYANMKPLRQSYHQHLIDWVNQGGTLIYLGRDNDPFQTIREWWNQEGNNYAAPSHHLFDLAGIKPPQSTQSTSIGQGRLIVIRKNPKELAFAQDGGQTLIDYVQEAAGGAYSEQNALQLERGPYDILGVLDESISQVPRIVEGPVIDLYDADLPVLPKKTIHPGERALLYNLKRNTKQPPCVLAAASRASNIRRSKAAFALTMKGPAETNGIARLLFDEKPTEISAVNASGDDVLQEVDWDSSSRTLLLRYPNSPEGITLRFKRSEP